MHLSFLGAAAVAFIFSFPLPAAAEIKMLFQASEWKVLGGLNDDGIAVCTLAYVVDQTKFSLVLLKNSPVLHIQLSRTGNDNKLRRQLTIDMRFDNEPAWRSENGIMFVDTSGAVLDFFTNSSMVGDWLNRFKQSSGLTIAVRNTDVRDWHVELVDPEAIGGAMIECVAWAHDAPEPPPYRP